MYSAQNQQRVKAEAPLVKFLFSSSFTVNNNNGILCTRTNLHSKQSMCVPNNWINSNFSTIISLRCVMMWCTHCRVQNETCWISSQCSAFVWFSSENSSGISFIYTAVKPSSGRSVNLFRNPIRSTPVPVDATFLQSDLNFLNNDGKRIR